MKRLSIKHRFCTTFLTSLVLVLLAVRPVVSQTDEGPTFDVKDCISDNLGLGVSLASADKYESTYIAGISVSNADILYCEYGDAQRRDSNAARLTIYHVTADKVNEAFDEHVGEYGGKGFKGGVTEAQKNGRNSVIKEEETSNKYASFMKIQAQEEQLLYQSLRKYWHY